jgi:spore maturation protein CgeB
MLCDVNMRFFEAIATGKLLLTDYLPEQDKFATDGVHYLSFRDWKDLDNKIKTLLQKPRLRNSIGKAGSHHIRKNHSYIKRIFQMLEIVEGKEA